DLPGVPLASQDGASLLVQEGLPIRAVLRHPGLAEIFLSQDVGRDGRPRRRHRDALLAEDRGAIRVLDLRGAELEVDARVGTLVFLGEPPGDSLTRLLFWPAGWGRGVPDPQGSPRPLPPGRGGQV